MSPLHSEFHHYIPTIRAYARFAFRRLNATEREECVQEAIASAWKSFHALKRRGKDVSAFPSALARYAVKAVKNGRRVGTSQSSTDVMSPICQARNGFTVQSIDEPTGQGAEALRDALVYHRRARVPSQVAFRIDFPRWLWSLPATKEKVAVELAQENTTAEVAQNNGLTAGRVSQMRRELEVSWRRFHQLAA